MKKELLTGQSADNVSNANLLCLVLSLLLPRVKRQTDDF